MARWYLAFRIFGYAGGLAGVILFTLGRQSNTPNSLRTTLGAVLLIAGFAAFLVSYVLYTIIQMRRRAARRAEWTRRPVSTPPDRSGS